MKREEMEKLKTKSKAKYDKKRVSVLVMGLMVVVLLAAKGVNVCFAYITSVKEEKVKQEQIIEAKRLKAEEKAREEARIREEASKAQVGVKYDAKQYTYDAKKIESKLNKYDYSSDGEKVVFLTFDDGTSTTVTPKMLDVLKKENVKATFFLTGENIERGGDVAKELVKREFEEGHAIGNHSYSHDYGNLYPGRELSLDNFVADFKKMDELLKDIVGENFSTRVIRCPGGFMSWKGMDELQKYLDENNMASIDWNALNADAEGKKKNATELVEYAKETSKGKDTVVLLMHDTYGKEETAKALPQIIKYFKESGYVFKTLS